MASTPLPTIGWREWMYLPNLDIGPIKAKIDTGARTTALHAFDMERAGDMVRFKVHTIQGRDDFFIQAEAPFVEERLVRDSGAKATLRPIISTTLTVLGVSFTTDVSLIDRQDMSFRLLLGRTAVADRFLVNCAHEYLGGTPEAITTWSPP